METELINNLFDMIIPVFRNFHFYYLLCGDILFIRVEGKLRNLWN